MILSKSMEFLAQAKDLIPLASQTFSKSYKWFPEGAYPVYLEHGRDGHVVDVDGNEYVDLICGLGAISLGYCHPVVDAAITAQLHRGINFSLPSVLEVELAQLLRQIIPNCEQVRFSKNGTDVTNAAVRLARYHTGREKVAFCGYHGGSNDWYGITTDRNAGIPKAWRDYAIPFEYNSIASLEKVFAENHNQIACVIMEPIMFTWPKPTFLDEVCELAHDNGALFVLDEMVTGFRMDIGGAQKVFGLKPDLACFGKAIANGMPLAVLCGKKEYMKDCDKIFFSYTFAGECLSLAAGIATVSELRAGAHKHTWHLGNHLCIALDDMKEEGLVKDVLGYATRPHIVLHDETQRSLLMQEMALRGVLMHSAGINLCASHSEIDIACVVVALQESLEVIRDGKVKLEGRPIMPTFRRI